MCQLATDLSETDLSTIRLVLLGMSGKREKHGGSLRRAPVSAVEG